MVNGTKFGSQFWLMNENWNIFDFILTVKMVTNQKWKTFFVPLTNFEGQFSFINQKWEPNFVPLTMFWQPFFVPLTKFEG